MRAAMRVRLIVRPTHSHQHTRAHVVSENYSAKEMRAVDRVTLGDGESRRECCSSGMRSGGTVGIIRLVGMSKCAVCQSSFDRPTENAGRNDGGGSRSFTFICETQG